MLLRLKLSLHGQEVQEVELEPGREYTFGRGSTCDVVLESLPGISRNHFKVFEENGQWTVQVLSKFGEVIYAGQPVNDLVLETGTVFKLAGYDFQLLDPALAQTAEESAALPMAVGQNEAIPVQNAMIVSPGVAQAPAPLEDFEGNEEATRVGVALTGLPHVRIVESGGEEETLKLEGRKWTAGREAGCEILLNDRKASRRQFELTSSPQGYFIRDLGSSNGTLLNGSVLAHDELKPLRSGDVIQVGGLTVHFEVRDPSFEKRLMVIPPEMMAAPPALAESPFEMINYPVPSGPGGAVRVDPNGGPVAFPGPLGGLLGGATSDEEKKKKLRFYAIVGAVLALFIAFMMSGQEPAKPKNPVTQSPFSRLTPQQQQVVRETYILAKNLLLQGKYDLSASQLQKLHEILPEGYEESLQYAEQCRQAAETKERMEAIERERKQQEENRRIVDKNLSECEPIANRTLNLDELRSCLAPTYERDPENSRITEMLARVQVRIDNKQRLEEQRRDYAERVSKGRGLYMKAERFEAEGNVFGALDAYKKHVDASYPDPENLKAKSQSRILSITKKISAQVDEALSAAKAAYSSQNYRDAIENIKKAKELDPKNEEAAELNAKIRRELNIKLKEIYQESIINEGLGQLDRAKENWKKILDTDHPDGDYYKKARSKLHAYGAI